MGLDEVMYQGMRSFFMQILYLWYRMEDGLEIIKVGLWPSFTEISSFLNV